jgi:N-acetylglucosaminyldiphosphoundecaprenol N-acetyl-beta-D-mannosaminyltransferase
MKLQKQSILGVSVTISPKEAILAHIKSFLLSTTYEPPARNASHSDAGGRSTTYLTIVTPNPEQVMRAQKDASFLEILNDADIALPDGAWLVWAMKKVLSAKYQVSSFQRISGVDFMEDLCKMAAENGWPVAFIGGKDGVAEKAFTKLREKYPGLTGFAEEGPIIQITNNKLQITNKLQTSDISDYIEALAKRIEKDTIRFVFIGLGAPKQEYFIHQLETYNLKLTTPSKPSVLMAVGGSFDFLAGKIPRAPKSVQKLGFEWLWRLFQEPWRLKRQMVLVRFLFQCLTMKGQKTG